MIIKIDSAYCAEMFRAEIDKLNAERSAILARSGGSEDAIYDHASEHDLNRFLQIEVQLSQAQGGLGAVQASLAGKGVAATAAVPVMASAASAPRSGVAYGGVTAVPVAVHGFMVPMLLEEKEKLLMGRSPEELLDSEVAAYAGIMAELRSHGYVEHGAVAHGAGYGHGRGAAAHGAGDGHGRAAAAATAAHAVALPAPAYAAPAPVVAEFNVYDGAKVNMLTAAYVSILRATEDMHIRAFEGAATIAAKEGLPSVQLLLAETRRQGSAVTATEIVGFLQAIMEWE